MAAAPSLAAPSDRMTLCRCVVYSAPASAGLLTVSVVALAERIPFFVETPSPAVALAFDALLAGFAAALAVSLWHPGDSRRKVRAFAAFLFAAVLAVPACVAFVLLFVAAGLLGVRA